jgi:hypothetical protein
MSSLRTPLPEVASDDAEAPSTQRARGSLPEEPAPVDAVPGQATPSSGEADFTAAEARASRSGRRGTRRPAREDTLLSLPAPAERGELELADRLEDMERRLDDLGNRVRVLEGLPRSTPGQAGARSWLIWLVFLLVLGVSWQLFRAGR